MKALVEVVGSAHEPDTALNRILEVVCELTRADDGSIGLVSADGAAVTIRAAHRMPASELGSVSRRGQGLAGAVLAANAPVRLDRYAELGAVMRPDLGENAVLGVPVVWRGQTVGFFGLGRRPSRTFADDEERLLQRFANYAAIVIQEARARAETRRLVDELDRLWRLGQDLSACATLQETVAAFLQLVATPGRFVCAVALHEPDHPNSITIVGRWSPTEGVELEPETLPDTPGRLDADLDAGRSVTVADVFTDPRCSQELRDIQRESGRSALALFPLMAESRRIGTVALSTAGPYDWGEDDLRPYGTAVSMLGSAIAARLSQVQQTANERRLAQFEVRQRLARELHDSVCQSLFAISLMAQSLGTESGVDTLVDLSREALADMRHLVRELQPTDGAGQVGPLTFAGLRAEGFVAALEKQISALREAGHAIGFEVAGDIPVHLTHEWPLLCAAQEAIGNAVRHSGAETIHVRMERSDGHAKVTVSDNGRGITPRSGKGLGLSSMKQRIEEAGGSFRLESAPGKGTTVRLEVPLEP